MKIIHNSSHYNNRTKHRRLSPLVLVQELACVFAIVLCGLLTSCSSKPTNVTKADQLPDIYPDYIGVTIPASIAPLDFNAADADVDCVDVVARGSKGGELHVNGEWAEWDIDEWHELTEQNIGAEITFTVCTKKNGQWTQYKDFTVSVSNYRLDDYGLTYRRIAPGYEVGGDIVEGMRQIVELFSVMPVVIQHVFEKRESFFRRRRRRVSVRMRMGISAGM